MSAAEQLGEVAPDYDHVAKLVESAPGITLGETVLKWYDVAPAEAPVPLAIRALARRNLRDASNEGELRLSGKLGFAILERCSETLYVLLVCTWLDEGERWEVVWAKTGERPFFQPHRREPIVHELAAVAHERRAWSEYLGSARNESSTRAYLASCYEGEA